MEWNVLVSFSDQIIERNYSKLVKDDAFEPLSRFPMEELGTEPKRLKSIRLISLSVASMAIQSDEGSVPRHASRLG